MSTAHGWIKVHRTLLNSGLIRNPHLCQVWLWCLLNASHKPYETCRGFQLINLNPGQLAATRREIGEALGLSPQTVRSCLEQLKTGKRLTIRSTNKYSIITIVNWDIYQNADAPEQQTKTAQPRRQTTNRQQTKSLVPIIQEEKEEQENKQGYFCAAPETDAPPPQSPFLDEEFHIPLVTVDKSTGRKHEYRVTEADAQAWTAAFPGVDVPQALRTMRQWCLANPSKCKTAGGVRRFIVNWLAKDQNSGRNSRSSPRGALTFKQQDEQRERFGRAKCVLELDGEEKFQAYCLQTGLKEDEVRAWIQWR